jgi:hypothetical protein
LVHCHKRGYKRGAQRVCCASTENFQKLGAPPAKDEVISGQKLSSENKSHILRNIVHGLFLKELRPAGKAPELLSSQTRMENSVLCSLQYKINLRGSISFASMLPLGTQTEPVKEVETCFTQGL